MLWGDSLKVAPPRQQQNTDKAHHYPLFLGSWHPPTVFLAAKRQPPKELKSWRVASRPLVRPREFWGIEGKIAMGMNYVQWLFLVPLKGGRWHTIPQLAVYTTYIPLIYHLYYILYIAFWGVICYLLPFRGTRNSHWYVYLPSLKLTVRTWKLVVGRWISFWGWPIFRGIGC